MDSRDDVLKRFVARRNKMLVELDVKTAREYVGMKGDDFTLLVSLHKLRYETTGVEPALRLESAEWLRERGYNRIYGQELLPPGELP